MLTLMRDHVKSLVNYDNINYTLAITVTLTALREKAGKVKYEYAFNPSRIYPHRVSTFNLLGYVRVKGKIKHCKVDFVSVFASIMNVHYLTALFFHLSWYDD